jgi:hypothetical protein
VADAEPKKKKKEDKGINSGLDDDAIQILHEEARRHQKEAKKDAEALQTTVDDKISQAEAEALAQAQAIVAAGGTSPEDLPVGSKSSEAVD